MTDLADRANRRPPAIPRGERRVYSVWRHGFDPDPIFEGLAAPKGRQWFWCVWRSLDDLPVATGYEADRAAAKRAAKVRAGIGSKLISPGHARGFITDIFRERLFAVHPGWRSPARPTGNQGDWPFAVVLGLPDPFTLDDVKAAYRARARATHPDAGGDADRFREVESAYRIATAYCNRAGR